MSLFPEASEAAVKAGSVKYLLYERMVVKFWLPQGGGYQSHSSTTDKIGKGWVWCQRGPDGKAFVVSDVVGWLRGGTFFGVEFKKPGTWPPIARLEQWASIPVAGRNKKQARFVAQWEFLRELFSSGGRAGIAESATDTVSIVKDGRPLGLFEDYPR